MHRSALGWRGSKAGADSVTEAKGPAAAEISRGFLGVQLDYADALARKAGMPLAPVMIYGDDVTHVLSAVLVWDLPFGQDKTGLAGALLDGWSLSTIFRYSSGIPYYFRSGFCNVPGAFRVGCIPAIRGNVFAQDPGSFDPSNGPLFDPSGFESTDAFNFYYGSGERVSDVRGFSYKNQDLSLIKTTRLGGDVRLEFRIEAFNIWNWHIFGNSGTWGDSAFNTDVSSPDFGLWNGTVSNPRNIQLSARLEF